MKAILLTILVAFLCACQSSETESEAQNAHVQDTADNTAENSTSDGTHTVYDYTQHINNDYLIDDQHSYVGFKIKYFGHTPVRGRFDEFDGTMFYDPDRLDALSVSIVIDVNSINTGNERRDNDLTSEGSWFNATEHPRITFQSEVAKPLDNGGFLVSGNLTMKGVNKIVHIEFEPSTGMTKDWAGNDQVDFSGKLVINRQDFGVFGGDFWSSIMEDGLTQLSDDVEIELDIHCRKPDYQVRYNDADSTDWAKQTLDIITADGFAVGLSEIDAAYRVTGMSAGKLSTIGYTLLEWEMYDDALTVFKRRLEYFPDKTSTGLVQIGIAHLCLGDYENAREHFQARLSEDTHDSRALEYMRLIEFLEGTAKLNAGD